MREIKFRVWSKFPKMFLDMSDACYYLLPHGKLMQITRNNQKPDTHRELDAVVQLYTGLKDKHGVEIYEGDIVKIDNNELYKITFKSGAFRATPLNKEALSRFCSDSGIIFVHLCRDDNVEVIGNIYENPELLGGKK